MNPLAVLLPALDVALNAPPLTVGGVNVPVEQRLPANTPGFYVLITQPSDTDAGGATGCEHFSCTVLLDVVTQFRTDQVSGLPAEQLVSQINQRLRRQRLALPAPWDCQPGTLEPGTQPPDELLEGLVVVRRLLRYRWEIYYHGSTGAPIAPALARATTSGAYRVIHAAPTGI